MMRSDPRLADLWSSLASLALLQAELTFMASYNRFTGVTGVTETGETKAGSVTVDAYPHWPNRGRESSSASLTRLPQEGIHDN